MKPTIFSVDVARNILLLLLCFPRCSDAFSRIGWSTRPVVSYRTTNQIRSVASTDDSFLDVEFERVQQKQAIEDEADDVTNKALEDIPDSGKTLLDLALEADPEWQEIRVPFCDQEELFIDCKLAITAELDGNIYGIGIPFGHAVIVTIEQNDGTILALNPDDDENGELLEIMAGALAKNLGQDLKLKKTPRVLTIEGDLDQYTKNWKTEIFGGAIDAPTLLDESDESMDSFLDFMKSELGNQEFESTIAEDFSLNDLDDIDPEWRKLFDIPGLGTESQDEEGFEQMVKNVFNADETSLEAPFKAISTDLEHEGVALKLVGFNFKDGNIYSLVKPLKPYTLVGKKSNDEDDLRFCLLTKAESKLVIPRLQDVCRADLKVLGLELLDK